MDPQGTHAPGEGRRSRRRRWVLDVAVTLLVLWFTLGQFGSRGFGDVAAAREPDGLGFALVLLATLPLLGRRRAPLAVLGLVAAAGLAVTAAGYGVVVHAAPAVALFTLAGLERRPPVRAVAAVAALAFAGVALAEVLVLDEYGALVAEAVLWSAAWIVGDRRRIGQQRRRDQRERTIAQERTRIARDLHDSAGHAINVILVQAGAARLLHEREPARSREAIATIEQVARETMDDIDRLVGALRDGDAPELAPLAGVAGIATLAERLRAGGMTVRVRTAGQRELGPALDRAAYRIAQEALTNAARHGAGSAEVELDYTAEALELSVRNPLRPGATARNGGGHGIAGMRERAALLGGRLEAGAEGDAFRVRAVLPYTPGPG